MPGAGRRTALPGRKKLKYMCCIQNTTVFVAGTIGLHLAPTRFVEEVHRHNAPTDSTC